MNRKQIHTLLRIVAAAAMTTALHFARAAGAARFLLYLVPYLTVGYDILGKSLKGVKNRQIKCVSGCPCSSKIASLPLPPTKVLILIPSPTSISCCLNSGKYFWSIFICPTSVNFHTTFSILFLCFHYPLR